MSPQNRRLRCRHITIVLYFYSTSMLYSKRLYGQYNQCTSVEQEGAEEEPENNEDAPDDVIGGEGEDKEQEKTKRERKTTKYMTKYERARILGTRALQIRLIILSVEHVKNLSSNLILTLVFLQHECSSYG
jgi:hypothetical protein